MGRTRISRILSALALLTTLVVVGAASTSSPANAETGQKALVLTSSVSGGSDSHEAQWAEELGFTVTMASDAEWAAMTAATFADHQLVVIGDPTCGSVSSVVGTNATALSDAVMARAGGNTKVGNRVLVGTDPVFHYFQGGQKLLEAGIAFAGVVDGATNLYLTTSCGVSAGIASTLLPQLTVDPTPGWTESSAPPCGGAVSLISNAAQFSTVTSADLQGWGCSVHLTYPTFPSDWLPLAVATDTTTTPTCGSDVDTNAPACGEAYVLVSGSGLTATAPNLALTPSVESVTIGSPATVTATVTNPDTSPRSGVTVTFLVTGANAGTAGTCAPATCVSDAEGHVTFTYTGAAEGIDTIVSSITVDGSTQNATADKAWSDGIDPLVEICDNGVDDDGDGDVDVDDSDCATPSEKLCDGKVATIVGSNDADSILGTPGDDVIVGRLGNDTIMGGGGNDTICAGSGNDSAYGGNGDDIVQGNRGNDLLHGNKGADKLAGQQGDDDLQGDQGNDRLAGGDGDDRLAGGEDVDTCDPGPGVNSVYTCEA